MASDRANPPESSKVIEQRYLLLRQLRSESWGEVWLAHDNVLGMEVALKLFPVEAPEGAAARKFFEQEAALARTLRHPLILGVFHMGLADNFLYLVEEAFPGESLLAQLARKERFSLTQALNLLEQVSEALAFAHARGLAHQGLNPLPLLVKGEEVRVANFAFPREDGGQVLHLELKAYDPPEVIQGEEATPASNVFSLGVLGFRLVAGSLPYALTFDEPFPYRLEISPEDLEEIPIPLQNLLLRCLAMDPEERFADAGAFAAPLRQVREQWGAGPLRWAPWKQEKRAPWKMALAAAYLGKIWAAGKSGVQKIREHFPGWCQHLRQAPPRLWWGLGLATLLVVLAIAGYKLQSRTPAPAQPPAAGLPYKLPPVGGGPPLGESGETPAVEPAAPGKPASQPPAVRPEPAAETKPAAKEEKYLLLVGNYAKEDQARTLYKRLKAHNFPARLVKKTTGGKTVYVVQVGPVTGTKPAEELARRLKTQEKLSPKIQKLASAKTANAGSRRQTR
jgi:eukaryotic-like serine/threonine-protein kinase